MLGMEVAFAQPQRTFLILLTMPSVATRLASPGVMRHSIGMMVWTMGGTVATTTTTTTTTTVTTTTIGLTHHCSGN